MTLPGIGYYAKYQHNIKYRLTKLCHMARNRAKTKNLPFDIDSDYLYELFIEQDGRCAVSNRELELDAYEVKHVAHPNAPSLDRIVPELGYTKGNVRIVCYQVNMAIGAYGLEAFIKLCEECL